MITRVHTIEQIKAWVTESLFNNSTRVTKVSPHSILNGFIYGISRVFQKVMREVSLLETYLFPDSAIGSDLDAILLREGLPARFGAVGSATWVRIMAEEGTVYPQYAQLLSTQGIAFRLEESIIVPPNGYVYAKVSSITVGSNTNIVPLSIYTFSDPPAGHLGVFNEYGATGGRDAEDDETVRARIRNISNVASIETIERITQLMMVFNPNVLRIFHGGVDELGKVNLYIATQNGAELTQDELQALSVYITPWLSVFDLNPYNPLEIGITLRNVNYTTVSLDMAIAYDLNIGLEQVRRDIQINLTKYLDFRFWANGQPVEYARLIEIVRSTNGVLFVSNNSFLLNSKLNDLYMPSMSLPMISSFVLRDLNLNILLPEFTQPLPVFYPNKPNQQFRQLV